MRAECINIQGVPLYLLLDVVNTNFAWLIRGVSLRTSHPWYRYLVKQHWIFSESVYVYFEGDTFTQYLRPSRINLLRRGVDLPPKSQNGNKGLQWSLISWFWFSRPKFRPKYQEVIQIKLKKLSTNYLTNCSNAVNNN